jgi:DNA-binding MarR family transcriptional regulator
MSAQASVFVCSLRGISRGEKAVLHVLARYHFHDTGKCRVDQQQIGADAAMTERHVIRLLQSLEAKGVIARQREHTGRGAVTLFTFPGLSKRVTSVTEKGDICAQKGDIRDTAIRKKKLIQETNTETQHACGAVLNPMQEWMRLKSRLLSEFPGEAEWLQPMYFLKVMGSDTLLLALPPAGRIIAAAKAQQKWLDQHLAPLGFHHRLTRYPDDYELGRLAQEFPEIYAELPAPLRKRKPQSAVSA